MSGEDLEPERRRSGQSYRTVLAVPLLRDGRAHRRHRVWRVGASGRFTEQQIALLQTFADQAVIAIENVRLFKELQARNADSPRRWSSRPRRARSCG